MLIYQEEGKKVRFDPNCVVAIFELGMIFESAEQFRKLLQTILVNIKLGIVVR